jgi:2-succinyl-6-hydroxy-2,4-cyclohexadiene-1-carboxylate synthase
VRVFLHGFTGSPESWRGFDGAALPIYGHRGVAEEPSSWERELELLAAQISAPCTIAGYSMGARIALALLVRYPQLFDRAVLIGGTAGLPDTERAQRRDQDELWAQQLEHEGIDAFADRWEQQPILRTVSKVTADRLDRYRKIRRTHHAAGLAASLRVLGTGAMPNLWDALPTVAQPVALVAGAEDTKFRALAEKMLAALPEAELAIVPGCGHNVLLERPDALRDYFP